MITFSEYLMLREDVVGSTLDYFPKKAKTKLSEEMKFELGEIEINFKEAKKKFKREFKEKLLSFEKMKFELGKIEKIVENTINRLKEFEVFNGIERELNQSLLKLESEDKKELAKKIISECFGLGVDVAIGIIQGSWHFIKFSCKGLEYKTESGAVFTLMTLFFGIVGPLIAWNVGFNNIINTENFIQKGGEISRIKILLICISMILYIVNYAKGYLLNSDMGGEKSRQD